MKTSSNGDYERIPLDDHQHFFYTYDLGCAAALSASDYELVSLDKSNPQKVMFIYKKEPGIVRVVDSYWADKLDLKARKYFESVKMLKNRIYSS